MFFPSGVAGAHVGEVYSPCVVLYIPLGERIHPRLTLNLARLSDVFQAFPDSKDVNRAARAAGLAKRRVLFVVGSALSCQVKVIERLPRFRRFPLIALVYEVSCTHPELSLSMGGCTP